jgi:hypothetical protein
MPRLASLLTPVRAAVAGVAVLLIALVIWRLFQGNAQTQANATFTRLANEIAANDASAVVAELDPHYEFTAMWPGTFESAEADGMSAASAEAPRALARRGLAFEFMQNPAGLRMVSQVAQVATQADGTVSCEVSLEVRTGDGGPILVAARPSHHFVLRWNGWLLPKLLILSHDHIDLVR